MEKWQLAGIISDDSGNEISLPFNELRKRTGRGKRSTRTGNIAKFFQTTLRKMTEVIALF